MTFQEIISSIESLSSEEQNELFELIRTNRQAKILADSQELMQAFQHGTAKKGNVNDLIKDLLGDDDENCLE